MKQNIKDFILSILVGFFVIIVVYAFIRGIPDAGNYLASLIK
jgi:hypothetical protein